MDLSVPVGARQNGKHQHIAEQLQPHTDILTIIGKDNIPQDYPLQSDAIVIGRSSDNDIVLNDYAISRYHIKLESTPIGWQITDLNSTNGALLDNKRLPVDDPQLWKPGAILAVGPYELKWRRHDHNAMRNATIVMNVPEVAIQPAPAAAVVRSAASSPVSSAINGNEYIELGVQIDQSLVSRGDTIRAEISMLSLAIEPEEFKLSIEGIPGEWIDLPDTVFVLQPTELQKIQMLITLPVNSQVRQGEHNLTVGLRGRTNPRAYASDSTHFEVREEHDFNLYVRTASSKTGAVCDIAISNQGNAADFYTISATSQDDALQFNSRSWQAALTPATQDTIRMLIQPTTRPMLGRVQSVPWTVRTVSNSGLERFHHGDLAVYPYLTVRNLIWMVVLVTLLAAAIWAVATFSSVGAAASTIEQLFSAIERLSPAQLSVVGARLTGF